MGCPPTLAVVVVGFWWLVGLVGWGGGARLPGGLLFPPSPFLWPPLVLCPPWLLLLGGVVLCPGVSLLVFLAGFGVVAGDAEGLDVVGVVGAAVG